MYNIFIFNKTETRLKTKRNSSKKMTHKTFGDFRRKANYKHEKKNGIWSHWCRSKRLSSA